MENPNDLESNNLVVSISFGVMSMNKKLTELTNKLKVNPSNTFQIGDEINTRTGVHKRRRSVWQLRSERNVLSKNLEDHIEWLLERIEPFQNIIQEYLIDTDVQVDIRINCHCPDSIGGISVQSNMMQRLARLSNRIDIGFIGEPVEPEGEN